MIKLVVLSLLFSYNSYCGGWSDGYIAGYCYNEISCITPVVPICPIPTIQCSDGFQCGYDRGFAVGLNAR
jgi:hypothetical protein